MPQGEIVIKLVNARVSDNTSKAGGKKKSALQQSLDEEKELEKFYTNPVSFIANQIKEGGGPNARLKAYAFTQGTNLLMNTINNSLSFYMSNIGNWTGDIETKRAVQNVSINARIAKTAADNILSGVGAGGLVGGVPGALIGGAIGVVNTAISGAEAFYNYGVNVATDNRSVLFAKQRAGQELTNWSR